jgi:hypothetical protein
MLKAHHWRGAFLAEMPVGEAHTADILELGRRGFAEIDVRHGSSNPKMTNGLTAERDVVLEGEVQIEQGLGVFHCVGLSEPGVTAAALPTRHNIIRSAIDLYWARMETIIPGDGTVTSAAL